MTARPHVDPGINVQRLAPPSLWVGYPTRPGFHYQPVPLRDARSRGQFGSSDWDPGLGRGATEDAGHQLGSATWYPGSPDGEQSSHDSLRVLGHFDPILSPTDKIPSAADQNAQHICHVAGHGCDVLPLQPYASLTLRKDRDTSLVPMGTGHAMLSMGSLIGSSDVMRSTIATAM